MKSLHTLLKVALRRMDECGVEAARLQQEIDALHDKQSAIIERERQEIAMAHNNPQFVGMLPAYRLRVKWQIDEAQQQGRHLAAQLEEVRARLQEAYVEKSKFEQLIEQERLRAEADKAAREQAMLDEVAINRAGSTSK